MFCYHCGKELDDRAVFCPHCGTVLNEEALKAAKEAQAKAEEKDEFFDAPPKPQPAPAQQPVKATNVLALVGFILSFFVPLAGFICSIIGLTKSKNFDGNGKGLAIAGIVISCVIFVLNTIINTIYMPFLLDAILSGNL